MADRPPKPENRPSSPRFKKRGKPDQKAGPGTIDPDAIADEIKNQTDRGAAILAAAVLDRMLEMVIEKRLLHLTSAQRTALFGRMAPLSTFSTKIEIGYALGLYTIGAYEQLKMMQEVRNKFAHRLEPLRFAHPDIAKIINDAVDGAHSAASKCHRVVASKRTTLRGAVHGRG